MSSPSRSSSKVRRISQLFLAYLVILALILDPIPIVQASTRLDTDTVQTVIPTTTKVITHEARRYLQSVSQDGTYVFTRPARESHPIDELDRLVVGDVIVSDATEKSPYGFLRRVTAISVEKDFLVVETVQASLEEAVESGAFDTGVVQVTATDVASITDGRGNPVVLGDVGAAEAESTICVPIDAVWNASGGARVDLHGNACFTSLFELSLQFGDNRLKSLRFINYTNVDGNLHVQTSGPILNFNESVRVASVSLKPGTIWIGPIPIVYTPVLAIYAGVDGSISVRMDASAQVEADLTAGVTYAPETGLTPVHDAKLTKSQFGYSWLAQAGRLGVSVGPYLVLELFGGAAGSVRVGIDGTLEIETTRTDWKLYFGYRGQGCATIIIIIPIIDQCVTFSQRWLVRQGVWHRVYLPVTRR